MGNIFCFNPSPPLSASESPLPLSASELESESESESAASGVKKPMLYEEKYKEKLINLSPFPPELPNKVYVNYLQSATFIYYQVLSGMKEKQNSLYLQKQKCEKDWNNFIQTYPGYEDKSYENLESEEIEQSFFFDDCEFYETPKVYYCSLIREFEKEITIIQKRYEHLLLTRGEAINKLVQVEIEKQSSPLKFVIENTPIGQVIMTYGTKDKVFQYYSNHSIPYRYLEVAARKFVSSFDMLYVYIDMQAELEEQEKLPLEEKEATKLAKHIQDCYHKIKKNPNEKKFIPSSPKLPTSVALVSASSTTKKIIKSKSNTYVQIGRLSDFSPIPFRRTIITKKQKLSYRDFKTRV